MGLVGGPIVNNFKQDLTWSLDERESEMFDKFYYRAFPNLETIEITNDREDQRVGIDKYLLLSNGKRISIDEKKRRKDYGDILIEEYSVIPKDGSKKVVGWIGKHKHTDYIVYAIMPAKRVYLLPFLLLQKSWLSNYKEWKSRFGTKYADNHTYWTSNIPIPTKELLSSIKAEMDQQFWEIVQ